MSEELHNLQTINNLHSFMKRIILFVLTAVSLLFISSCEPPKTDEIVKVAIDDTEYTLPAEGGTVEVSFIPLTAWKAQCTEDFVEISPSSGEALTEAITVTMSVAANENSLARDIIVRLSFTYNFVDITIAQAGKTIVKPDPDPKPDTGNTEDVNIGEPIK